MLQSKLPLNHYRVVRMAMQRQRIVILGSSKWPPITFNASHTIAMILYEDSSDLRAQSTTGNGQARSLENVDPLDLRSFYFQKAVPSLSREQLVESIPDWDMVNLLIMMEKSASASLSRNPLYFCFKVKANIYFKF